MSLTDDKRDGGTGDPVSEIPDNEEAPVEDTAEESAPGDDPMVALEESMQKLQEENQFLLDQVQRARAELENFRRRTAEGREQQKRQVTAQVFRSIFPLVDSLMLAAKNDQDAAKVCEGIGIIIQEFGRVLEQFHIEAVPAVGEAFDPNWHEAMFHEETSDVPGGQVLEEFERGYRIGDDLIRPAKVKVAKSPEG